MTPDEKLKEEQAAMSTEKLIFLVKDEISRLARTGGCSHKMSVPPKPTDTDMLLSELVRRFEVLLGDDVNPVLPPQYGYEIVITENAAMQDGRAVLMLSTNDYQRRKQELKNSGIIR